MVSAESVEQFITKWSGRAGKESADSQSFLNDLCLLLEVPRPHDANPGFGPDDYMFEVGIDRVLGDTRIGKGEIDLYRRGCFVLESKQGGITKTEALATGIRANKGTATRGTKSWASAMQDALKQARDYARDLPRDHAHVPFLIVVDVGYCIELYADFGQFGNVGRQWNQFQVARDIPHRLDMAYLRDERVRAALRQVWLDPWSLDPSRRQQEVTRELAIELARAATSLEKRFDASAVSDFLMRCLFTMFAEDTGLLPEKSFTQLLRELRTLQPQLRQKMLEGLFEHLDLGGFSMILKAEIRRFNGRLFKNRQAFPLTDEELEALIRAAERDWAEVEPAIFGTLIERALDDADRHKLGAHYTPRGYVDRLVQHTLTDVLRADWDAAREKALQHLDRGQAAAAQKVIREFHRDLCKVRVLDPACGSGNFLYVALEHMKRLESDVLALLQDAGGFTNNQLDLEGVAVNPSQFLGLELNARAAAAADLVLWLGYLQWQIRQVGPNRVPTPVLQAFGNIVRMDAVLAWKDRVLRHDAAGKVVTRWGGRTIVSTLTGQSVPDPADEQSVYDYVEPSIPAWPDAQFIVGNPPFLGNWKMRQELGDGYAEALRALYPHVPDSADFVMYWWDRAAELTRAGKCRRFGFITTNSLRQVFARRVLSHHLEAEPALRLTYAIPDHPWVDNALGAQVRIAMTVADTGQGEGLLEEVMSEVMGANGEATVELSSTIGVLSADLRMGVDLTRAKPLLANEGLCSRGVSLHGSGFIVSPEKAAELGLGRIAGLERYIREYRNGRDITQKPRGVMVIDLFGLTEDEAYTRFPEVYQHVLLHVKPERIGKKSTTLDDQHYAANWWIFGKTRADMRRFLAGLERYTATVETAKHRFFVSLDSSILPDNKLVVIGVPDRHSIGVLSSKPHVLWALRSGSRLGVGNDPVYVKTRCFDTFPFPNATETQKAAIGKTAEQIDAHRKARQALYPALKLTDVYNVLEKLRAKEPLDAKEEVIHQQGVVSVLLNLHQQLDALVLDAYGWPADLSDDDILARLLALNLQRHAEEQTGLVRWLRPDYQIPRFAKSQAGLALGEESVDGEGDDDRGGDGEGRGRVAKKGGPVKVSRRKLKEVATVQTPWPSALKDQVQAVKMVWGELGDGERTAEGVAARFVGAEVAKVREVLEMMVGLGVL